jgi:hypothetical protein
LFIGPRPEKEVRGSTNLAQLRPNRLATAAFGAQYQCVASPEQFLRFLPPLRDAQERPRHKRKENVHDSSRRRFARGIRVAVRDTRHDRTLFFGTAGYIESFVVRPPDVVLNGSAQPAPMELKANTKYRFRLFNLAGDNPTVVRLAKDSSLVEWRAVAKDGYPLSPSQATTRRAELTFDPGEIYDYQFTPVAPGDLTLSFGTPGAAQANRLTKVVVHVR